MGPAGWILKSGDLFLDLSTSIYTDVDVFPLFQESLRNMEKIVNIFDALTAALSGVAS